MKSIFIFSLFAFSICNAQKLTTKDINEQALIDIYGFKTDTLKTEILSFYNCINENYPKQFKKMILPEITPTKTFLKKTKEDFITEKYSLFWQSGGGNYETRKRYFNEYEKCIKTFDDF